jgi:hypothetical protein
LGELRDKLLSHKSQSGIEIFCSENKTFYLVNEGNAVNFTWNNQTLGPYIYLVACEIIGAMRKLICEPDVLDMDRINVLSMDERREIASQWLDTFEDGI